MYKLPSKPKSSKNCLQSLLTVAAVALIASCSSDGDSDSASSTTTSQSTLQGDWQGPCVADDETGSISRLSFDGNSVMQTDVIYPGSSTCNTGAIFSLVSEGNFSLPNGATTTSRGEAQHIDLDFIAVEATSSPAFDFALMEQGLTFEQQLQTNLGITDISNISPEALGAPVPFFTLVLIDGDTLYVGDLESNQGNSAETRLVELDSENVFTRQ